ncbi:NAD(P)-binding domain protein [Niveomyces insectorum RCEF 264]|uniref:NAD(P)-binding domain protein n=1 Tax=Niveomyces insectorum RCEF 264 TaxID=1081102 RepID=A0A167P1N6_9HYPO|nr:NAD(P)-binding domain protein [Niveomyces insectorum RCEF 264]
MHTINTMSLENGAGAASVNGMGSDKRATETLKTEVVVIGGSLGGVACALAALRQGRRVVLTEEYAWLGGQLTSQAVPPDEHSWVEQFGVTRSYRALREGIRAYYRQHYPLTEAARQRVDLNPGVGSVSRLCHEPRVAVAVLDALLQPYEAGGKLVVVRHAKPVGAEVEDGRVTAVTLRRVAGPRAGTTFTVAGAFVVDATELGDLLPLTNTPYVTGFESRHETSEPGAPEEAQPNNQQAFSICFAVDYIAGEDHTIPRPARYDYWRSLAPDFWGAPLIGLRAPEPHTLEIVERRFLPNPPEQRPTSDGASADLDVVRGDQSRYRGDLDLWTFRRIAARQNFRVGAYASDICIVNWPMIDYFEAPLIDITEEQYAERLAAASELSYSMLYWLQTEAPHSDDPTGTLRGYPGLRLRGDITGTATVEGGSGLAMAPYVRESRRIRAVTTVVEQDVAVAERRKLLQAGETRVTAKHYDDSVGVGMYRIDLHPSTGGDTYIDRACCPFEIPLGALLPRNPGTGPGCAPRNLLAGCKNIGTTHITNGCYRLHPVEWNIGEAAGLLAAHCLATGYSPHEVQANPKHFGGFARLLEREGVETRWPEVKPY